MSILTTPHAVAARKAGQPVQVTEQRASEGGTTGHQAAEGSGLRGHSCGDTFPFDYVTLGNGTHVITRHGAPLIGPDWAVAITPEEIRLAGMTEGEARAWCRKTAGHYKARGLLGFERVGTWAEALAVL